MTTSQRIVDAIVAKGYAALDRAPEWTRAKLVRHKFRADIGRIPGRPHDTYLPEYSRPAVIDRLMIRVGKTMFY